MNIRIALPTGSSLGQQTIEILKEAGIIAHKAHPRSIIARAEGIMGVDEFVFSKPSEIPNLVATGVTPVGITGFDRVLCHDTWPNDFFVFGLPPYSRSGKGKVRCCIFVKEDDPVTTFHEFIDAVIRDGVITEYPDLVENWAYLETNEQIRISCTKCDGSAEAFVATGQYRFGATLIETGETLRANGLRELKGTCVFTSGPVLLVGKDACPPDSIGRIAARNILRKLKQ